MTWGKSPLQGQWSEVLSSEFKAPYMRELDLFLEGEARHKKLIYPPKPLWFSAFNQTPFEQVKVVILGQDPYHGAGQAHGLSFSVPEGAKIPPSLKNIYKELQRDLRIEIPLSGCLEAWAKQGVLLLNATLTVEQASAGSHQKRGWERFTDRAIARLNEQRSGLVFMLWGSYAQNKGQIIDEAKHCVLTAPHPSPLSAHRGFIGCGHFSAANAYLEKRKQAPIDWRPPQYQAQLL